MVSHSWISLQLRDFFALALSQAAKSHSLCYSVVQTLHKGKAFDTDAIKRAEINKYLSINSMNDPINIFEGKAYDNLS